MGTGSQPPEAYATADPCACHKYALLAKASTIAGPSAAVGGQKRRFRNWKLTCSSWPLRTPRHAAETPDSVAPAAKLAAKLPVQHKHMVMSCR